MIKPGRIMLYCDMCKEEFPRKLSDLKKSRSGHRFCSKKCKDNASKIDGGIPGINKSIKSGKYENYRAKFSDEELYCHRCGFNEFISSVAIHHIDEDRTNNCKETNLIPLCFNCHSSLHCNLWSLKDLSKKYESYSIFVGASNDV